MTPAVCEAKLRSAEPAPGVPAALALGARTTSRLDAPFDVDSYTLALEPGTYSTATASYCGAELDTVLTLRNGLGELVATDDDGGDGFLSALTFTVAVSAIYTIEVRANGGATGDYIVVIGAEP